MDYRLIEITFQTSRGGIEVMPALMKIDLFPGEDPAKVTSKLIDAMFKGGLKAEVPLDQEKIYAAATEKAKDWFNKNAKPVFPGAEFVSVKILPLIE